MIRRGVVCSVLVFGGTVFACADWFTIAEVKSEGFVVGSSTSMVKGEVHFMDLFGKGPDSMFNDQGQYFLDISATSTLTGYDRNGSSSPTVVGSNYTWLLNNYQSNKIVNSHIFGTGLSNLTGETLLKSDGFLNWYTPGLPSTNVKAIGWSGNYRLVNNGSAMNLQAEAVPEPFTIALGIAGIGLACKRRMR